MGLFGAVEASASALAAERVRMDVAAENLANQQTTRGVNGGPYQRKVVVLQEAKSFGETLRGVEVAGIVAQPGEKRVHDPGHPDADAEGYVRMPDIEPLTEMVDLISASRAYEANVTAMQTSKAMFQKTLEILR